MASQVTKELLEMADSDYKEFITPLIPTVRPESIIGIRVPVLRQYAKEIIGTRKAQGFLMSWHIYYEEEMLHALLINEMDDYERVIYNVENLMCTTNNWAVCDACIPPVFKRRLRTLKRDYLMDYIYSDKPYLVRFGINMFRKYYLDDKYFDFNDVMDYIPNVSYPDYYVMMAKAWYLSEALIKQYDVTKCLIEMQVLDKDTQNNTIQKYCDSKRAIEDRKTYLKQFKI